MRGPGAFVGAGIAAFAGCAFLATLLVAMNEKAKAPPEVKRDITTELNLKAKKKKKKKTPVKKPKPRPRKVVRKRAPAPTLTSNLAGLGAGVPFFDAGDLGDFGDDLLGADAGKDLVMSAESVDQQPELMQGAAGALARAIPKRAQAEGIEGSILFRLNIGADGSVKSLKVLETDLPDWYVEAVTPVVRNLKFNPATYQGQPVAGVFNYPISFKLS